MIYFIGGLPQREFTYFSILESIRNKNKGIRESFFDGDIKEEEKFMEKISFNSMFSSKELIVLKRAEKLKDIERVLDYIEKLDIPDKEIVIDYSREDGKIPSKLNKKLESLKKEGKVEVLLVLKEDNREMAGYIQKELEISPREAAELLSMLGNEPFKIRNEIGKIKAYLGGSDFSIDEVRHIISVEKEYRMYEMTESIFSGKVSEVLEYLEKTKEYMAILYSLYGELEMMYKLSCLQESGRKLSRNYNAFKNDFEEIKEVFKSNGRVPNSYAVFKKMERLRNYSNKSLKNLLFKCWETEKDIKTGKIEIEAGTEMLIMSAARSYGRKIG